MTTLLVVASYPFRVPVHGGQKRVAALAEAYGRAVDRVESIAIFNPLVATTPEEVGQRDIAASGQLLDAIRAQGELEDLTIGDAITSDSAIRARVIALLQELEPDIIVFEQPYLYLGFRELLDGLRQHPRIVYSSQNVEHAMKASMYGGEASSLTTSAAAEALARVVERETAICRAADLIIAVSDADADGLRQLGAGDVLVVPNGISTSRADPVDVVTIRQAMIDARLDAYALMTGSAHRPNATGLLDMVGSRLGYLPRVQSLYLAGDVGGQVHAELARRDPFYGAAFWSRAHGWGRVSDGRLSALIELAALVLLPIREGSGSNLKTAEAILSGRRVLATSFALRGYDGFRDAPGVTVIDDPAEYQAALPELLATSPLVLDDLELERRRGVLWERITPGLTEAIRSL